jgi:hypothetical protein
VPIRNSAATRQAGVPRHRELRTAGFSCKFFSTDDLKYRNARGIPTVVSGAFAALRTLLQFGPGRQWSYGIDIDRVGKGVEAVRGQRLGNGVAAAAAAALFSDRGTRYLTDLGLLAIVVTIFFRQRLWGRVQQRHRPMAVCNPSHPETLRSDQCATSTPTPSRPPSSHAWRAAPTRA